MPILTCRNELSSKELNFGYFFQKWAFLLAVAYLSVGPKQADMKAVLKKPTSLPPITFCMPYMYAIQHLISIHIPPPTRSLDEFPPVDLYGHFSKRGMMTDKWNPSMIYQTVAIVVSLIQEEREKSVDLFHYQMLNLGEDKLLHEMQARKISYEELVQKAGNELLDTSLRKFEQTIGGKKVPLKPKITWMDKEEICFTPDNINLTANQDIFLSLTVDNYPEFSGADENCMMMDFRGRTGLRNITERLGSHDKLLCLGRVHNLNAEGRFIHLSPGKNGQKNACRNYKGDLDTELNCRSRCRYQEFLKIFRCRALSLSYLASAQELKKYPLCNYRQSGVDSRNSNPTPEKNCLKNCHPDCTQSKFIVKDQESKGSKDLTTVNLKWRFVDK